MPDEVKHLEDPVEDVFVTNVLTVDGNRRIFEGIWEANDFNLQQIVDVFRSPQAPDTWRALFCSALALMKLSDAVAERVQLQRWYHEPSEPKGVMLMASSDELATRSRAISFTADELMALEILPKQLDPFVLREEDLGRLPLEEVGNSSLERRPLVLFDGTLVLALPNAVSPAIRRYALEELAKLGELGMFETALGVYQAQQLEREGLFELRRQVRSIQPPPHDGGPSPSLHSFLLVQEPDYFLHVVLLHDRLEGLLREGLSSFLKYPEPVRLGLQSYLEKVRTECLKQRPNSSGTTLIILGGLGRGFGLSVNNWQDPWTLAVLRLSDIVMLSRELDGPIRRFLKCIEQREWAEKKGVEFLNLNGDLNFYAFWRQDSHRIVSKDIPVEKGSMIGLSNDFVESLRSELRRQTDMHAVEAPAGGFVKVIRFGQDSYFRSTQRKEVFASLDDVEKGVLAGVVETPRGATWLRAILGHGGEELSRAAYELWSGYLGVLDTLVASIEGAAAALPSSTLEVALDFSNLAPINQLTREGNGSPGLPSIDFAFDRFSAVVLLPRDFLLHFNQPKNAGEVLGLRSIAEAIIALHGAAGAHVVADPGDLATRILSSGARILHMFQTRTPADYLLASTGRTPTLLKDEDLTFARIGLSEGCLPDPQARELATREQCNDFLKKIVEKLWGKIRATLQSLDRQSVIIAALRVQDSILRDRGQWRRTASALIALYPAEDDVATVALERERERNTTSAPARMLIEMAVCECLPTGGKLLGFRTLESLLADAAVLFEVASDSDAVWSGLITPRVSLFPNGEYEIDHSFHEKVLRPFLVGHFTVGFNEAALAYDSLYESRSHTRPDIEEVFGEGFIAAYQAEYGLSPQETVECVAGLLDIGVEQNTSIVEFPLQELMEKLTSKEGVSRESAEAFIKSFTLSPRPSWETPPAGFSRRDISPWRFRRRLACIVRPIIALETGTEARVIYSLSLLEEGFRYIFENLASGGFPQVFFKSLPMKKHLGALVHRLGHEFTLEVAKALNILDWRYRAEINMTELGGTQEMGDVDVLAWKDNSDVILIECKRLQLAKTISEISEICSRFKGEAKDELDKHVKRVEWLTANRSELSRVVGFQVAEEHIQSILVTSTDVPMMYLDSLPIPPTSVIPFRDLQSRFGSETAQTATSGRS